MTSPVSFSQFSQKHHEKLPPLTASQTTPKNIKTDSYSHNRDYESKLCDSFANLRLQTHGTPRLSPTPSSQPTTSTTQRLGSSTSLPSLTTNARTNQTPISTAIVSPPSPSQKSTIKQLTLRLSVFSFTQIQRLTQYPNLEVLFIEARQIEDRAFIGISQLKKLKVLSISSTPLHTSSLVTILKSTNLTHLTLSNCQTLENVSESGLENLKNLRVLKLRNCGLLRSQDYYRLITAAPKLTTLNLENAQLDDTFFTSAAKQINLLENCSLHRITGYSRKGLQIFLLHTQSLKTLSLSHLDLLSEDICQEIHDTLPKLEELSLESCHRVNANVLSILLSSCPIKKLTLSNCFAIKDNALTFLIRINTLTALNLTSCYKLTNDALVHLMKMRTLQSLTLSHTRKMTSAKLQKLQSKRFQTSIKIIPLSKIDALCIEIEKKKEALLKELFEKYNIEPLSFVPCLPTIEETH